MSEFVRTIRAVLAKDLISELRNRQLVPTMIMLGVLIAWILRIATESMEANAAPACAAVLVTLLFSAILACERSFAVEQHNDCISSLLVSPADAGTIYLAKLLANLLWLCLFEIVTVPVILVLFKAAPGGGWWRFVGVLMLCNVAVCSVGTLLGAVVQQTQGAGSLLSVVAMAALCPMMLPAVSTLLVVFASAEQGGNVGLLNLIGDFGSGAGYLVAFDAVFVTVCWLLFGFVVRE